MMRSTVAFAFSTLVTVATALQIVSDNPGFASSGRTGCIAASANATNVPVIIEDCGDNSNQDWIFTPLAGGNNTPQPLRIFGDKCLDVINGVNADGTKLQIFTCVPGNTNQLWLALGDSFQWAGTNKCIDLTDGSIINGNQLQVFTCDSLNTNQRYHVQAILPPPTPPPSALLRASGAPVPLALTCLIASSNTDNARVSLDACGTPNATFPGGNDTWVIPAPGTTGPISTYNGAKCLDVTNGDPTNGNLVQVFTCFTAAPNQQWRVDGIVGRRSFTWVGQNKCLDVKDGIFNPGTAQIQIWDCDSTNLHQWWSPQ